MFSDVPWKKCFQDAFRCSLMFYRHSQMFSDVLRCFKMLISPSLMALFILHLPLWRTRPLCTGLCALNIAATWPESGPGSSDLYLSLVNMCDCWTRKVIVLLWQTKNNKPKIGPNRCAKYAPFSLSLSLSYGTVETIASTIRR